MSQKSIVIQRPKPAGADAWINDAVKAPVAGAATERRKRLTLDVSEDLHRRIKMSCVGRGELMADVLREILENAFPDKPNAKS